MLYSKENIEFEVTEQFCAKIRMPNFGLVQIRADKVEIPSEKITDYLLVQKAKNDKSEFLSKLGYSLKNWNELEIDILKIIENNDAHLKQSTPFGDIYEVKGKLRVFGVVTI